MFAERRDWLEFSDAYGDPSSGAALPNPDIGTGAPVCRGPITYTGREALDRDIANLKAALDAAGLQEGYMNSVAPGSCARFGNEYYETDQDLMYACADALREEYAAIIDAGLVLQLDDPAIAENWDQINPEPSVEDYQRFTMLRVDALNHAIRDLPEDRIRFHLCWGSWHGPHVTDIPMRDIVDGHAARSTPAPTPSRPPTCATSTSGVSGSDVELPEGKVILPGVVSHSTNVVEHPEVVADRIARFAEGVGRERVIASTDCGLGGRVHPQIAWAKLGALAEGARLATTQLWGSGVPA